MPSIVKYARILASLAAIATGIATTNAEAHPRGHELDRQSVGLIQSDPQSEGGQLSGLEEALKADPTDEKKAVDYARHAVKLARRLGDTGLLRRAERALSPWDNNTKASADTLIVRATIKQIDHRFHDALSDLEIVLKHQPSNPQALLSRAFIRATIGEAKSGAIDCAALRARVSNAIRETCFARLESLSGALDSSYHLIEAILQKIPETNTEERTFALSVAAEIAHRRGLNDKAAEHFGALFSADPNSVFARAAYAEFLLGRGDHEMALKVIGSKPHTEALLLMSTLAGKGAENPVSIKSASELGARMAADEINGDYSHAREYARFCLDYLNDSKCALFFAQQNWRVQKEPIDARVLARAAIKNGENIALANLKQWLQDSGLEDPGLSRILANSSETLEF